MSTYTIQFDQKETAAIYSTFDQVPLQGVSLKALAASVQAKIEAAQPDPEPEPVPSEEVKGSPEPDVVE